MACKYYYKGHKFDSELALDDFLLELKPLESVLGDMVFQDDRTLEQKVVLFLLQNAQKNVRNHLKSVSEKVASGELKYMDGEVIFGTPPHYGVTKFLSGLKNSNDDYLFPEFREEEYWKRRFNSWSDPNIKNRYTIDEIDEFGLTQDDIISDPEQQKKMRALMEKRWLYQGEAGTAIHSMLQILFSWDTKAGDYRINKSEEDLYNYIGAAFNASESKLRKYAKYLSTKTVQSTIKYAKDLNNQLIAKFGPNLAYYSEYNVMATTNHIESDGKPKSLLGKIDLLVVDSNGKCHILDYKTSIHEYNHFSSPKKLAYTYQLYTYQRMLERSGINTYEGNLLVAPILLLGFKKSGESYSFDNVSSIPVLESVNRSSSSDNILSNIDDFLPSSFKLSVTTSQALQVSSEKMYDWFSVNTDNINKTREDIIQMLKDLDALTPNENGIYTYRTGEKPITAKTESEFINKVVQYELNYALRMEYLTGQVKSCLREAMLNRNIEGVLFPSPVSVKIKGRADHLKNVLSEYCTGSWEIVDNELLESKGIIMVKTLEGIDPKQIDLIRISKDILNADPNKALNKKNGLKNRTLITSKFESDVVLRSRENSLALEMNYGNIELMETMLLLNQTQGLEGYVIGKINVVNPRYANAMSASNEELLYCWKELNRFSPVKFDKFKSGEIKFATYCDKVLNNVYRLLHEGKENDWQNGYLFVAKMSNALTGEKNESTSVLDTCINGTTSEKIRALEKLNDELIRATSIGGGLSSLLRMSTFEEPVLSKEAQLHTTILNAIAYLKGINYRQQLRDHDNWCESVMFWKNGIQGLMIDNPGSMPDDTLNLITKLLYLAYLNTRDYMMNELTTINKFVKKLREKNNMGYLKRHTVGNQVSMYANMIEETPDGDLLFKNPNRLVGVEREFQEYLLYKINKNRFPHLTDKDLKKLEEEDNLDYYRVPITRGSIDTKVSVDGLMGLLKSKLRFFNPKTASSRLSNKTAEIINATDEEDHKNSEILFLMTNEFDRGERANRLELIREIGMSNIEHNLESLIYKHLYAYAVKDNVNSIFPMIKAAYIHITTQGTLLNNSFNNTTEYFKKFIKNKIFNESIQDPKLEMFTGVLANLRSAASKLTLAFSPILLLYQPLMGLWVDTRLWFKESGDKQVFTLKHFKRALATAYADAFHYTDDPTFCSSFNMLYALNDMDTNEYASLINSSRSGIFNFWKFALKPTTRPDYYNRLTIFFCKMLADGCFDAHFMKDGKLIYDWTKDKRFDAFAKGNTSDPRYNLQKSLYYAIAKLFEAEGTRNPDGTKFVLDMSNPMPLPRAYTTLQAEGIKSLCDDMYGYYSHEKKSLLHATWLGATWMQFKTFWSGKKNQYLLSGGIRLRGDYKHITFDGKPQYYQVVDGEVRYDLPFTEEDTGAPVIEWGGQWLEGIILTLSDLVLLGINDKSLKASWNNLWNNPNADLQAVYRSNIKLAGFDICMWIMAGLVACSLLAKLVQLLEKDTRKDHDWAEGLGVSALSILQRSLKNSFLDFNVYHTVGAPGFNWLPFMFNWTSREFKNWINVAVGDESFYDALIRTSSATNAFRPFFTAIKPESLWTPSEGGTYGQENKK